MTSSGLKFAQSQLEKYGWSEGKGLGREEGGITEALKPKLKFDNAGLGHDKGEEYKFQWWDHVFNKAADNISIEKVKDGSIQLKQKEALKVSKKRPSSATNKTKFYGGFVKGGTLVGQEEKVETDEEEEEEKDKSLKLSDQELFRVCGGRTAHKGARHGLNMTAKLARVEEQERLLLQAWAASNKQGQDAIQPRIKKKKSKKEKHRDDMVADENVVILESEEVEKSKKKKKKRKEVISELHQESVGGTDSGLDICCGAPREDVEGISEISTVSTKKKKRKNKVRPDEGDACVTFSDSVQGKKKRKKRKSDTDEESAEMLDTDIKIKKKKKKHA